MEETKESTVLSELTNELSELPMSVENNTDLGNSSTSVFGETVLCTQESLGRLPDGIIELWEEYCQGNLAPVTSEEVNTLLHKWFHNESIGELPTFPGPDNYGQQPVNDQKRRRVDCHV